MNKFLKTYILYYHSSKFSCWDNRQALKFHLADRPLPRWFCIVVAYFIVIWIVKEAVGTSVVLIIIVGIERNPAGLGQCVRIVTDV
jgi:hypothetical protein